MAGRSFSFTQLVEACATAGKVYQFFHQDCETAPERIRQLSDTVNHLWNVLTTLKTYLRLHGSSFYGEVTFVENLQDCEVFISAYSVVRLADPANNNDRKRSVTQAYRRIWIITRHGFDDSSTHLYKSLTQELSHLNYFILTFSLRQATKVRNSKKDGYRNLFQRLQVVGESCRSEVYRALEIGRDPDLTKIYSELESVWMLLCEKVDLAGDKIPALRSETLLQSTQLLMPFTTSAYSLGNTTTYCGIGPSSQHYTANDRVCIVKVNFPGYIVALSKYSVSRNKNGSTLVWGNEGTTTVLTHHVPLSAFPHTFHSSLGSKLRIKFLEEHRLILETNGIRIHDYGVIAEYEFFYQPQHQHFQEDIRDKDLIFTVEFDMMISKRPETLTEKQPQDIKLWRSKDSQRLHSLSFFSIAAQKHLEYNVCWFKGKIDRKRPEQTVWLVAKEDETSFPPAASSVRRSSWSTIKTKLPWRSKSNESSPMVSGMSSPRYSGQSTARHSSRSSPRYSGMSSPQHGYRAAMSSSNPTYDDYQFSVSGTAIGLQALTIKLSNTSHYDAFVENFDEAHRIDEEMLDSIRPRQEIGPLAEEQVEPQQSTESPSRESQSTDSIY